MTHGAAPEATVSLRDGWELRNSAAETLIKIEQQLRAQFAEATPAEVVALLEAFSPARSPGPEWTRSFDALVEHLWAWCAPALLVEVEENFRARGPAWVAVSNALQPEHGEHLRMRLLHHASPTRLPSFTLG